MAPDFLTVGDARRLIAERDAAANAPAPAPEPAPETVQPAKYNPFRREGDPDAQTLRRLSVDQLLEMDEAEPGTSERLARADAWDKASVTQGEKDQAAREQAEYDKRVRTDPDFLAVELRKRARQELEARFDYASEEELCSLAADAGLSPAAVEKMASDRQAARSQERLRAAGVTDARAWEQYQAGDSVVPAEPHEGPRGPEGTDSYNKSV